MVWLFAASVFSAGGTRAAGIGAGGFGKEIATMRVGNWAGSGSVLVSGLVLVLGWGWVGSSAGGELRVGMATRDITPPLNYPMAGYFSGRSSTGTLDPLMAKALVLEQDGEKVALVFCDVISVNRSWSDAAREGAARAIGVSKEKVGIGATHTHTGPELREGRSRMSEQIEAYQKTLIGKVIEAVAEADRGLAPGRLEFGAAGEPGRAFNRRFFMKDGTVRTNPGVGNPEVVRAAGPIDPEVGLIRVRRDGDGGEGIDDGLVCVYALHLDTTGGTEYSKDFPHYCEVALREKLGPNFLLMFGAGTCGNINHIDVLGKNRPSAREIGTDLAKAVEEALPGLEGLREPRLRMVSGMVDAPLQDWDEETLALARETKAKQDRGENVSSVDVVTMWRVLDLATNYPREGYRLEVQAVRLGSELALVTLPGEVFVELGLDLKRRSPFRRTLVMELSNETPAYIPNREAYPQGSYEVNNSRVRAGVGEALVDEAVRLLEALKGGD